MLTHLYQGYNGDAHLSFAVHLTQVRHTSQSAEECGVSGCLSQLCLPGKSAAAFKLPTAAVFFLTEQTNAQQCRIGP